MGWRERIESDPSNPDGMPLVRGTRIPVSAVVDRLAVHVALEEVLESYPSLSEEDVRACVAWAAECVHAHEHTPDHGRASHADVEESPVPGEAGSTPEPAPVGGEESLMDVLLSMPDVGEDADFERPVSYGRPDVDLS